MNNINNGQNNNQNNSQNFIPNNNSINTQNYNQMNNSNYNPNFNQANNANYNPNYNQGQNPNYNQYNNQMNYNLVNCKACGKQIARGTKKCVHCGKDQRNFFMRHKIVTVIVGLFIIGSIGAALDPGSEETKQPISKTTTSSTSNESKPVISTNTNTNASKTTSTTNTPKPKVEEPKTEKYSTGTYLVNKDIKSGLYKVTLTDDITKMGYIERSKDLNMELDSILANIILTGNGYVEILKTDVAVKLQGVEIEPINIKNLKPSIKKEASDGIYLIGYDLAPGTYKVEVTDSITKMGYIERAKSVAMGMDDIIANEIAQGQGYVKIEKGDFAVRLQGVKIKLQE